MKVLALGGCGQEETTAVWNLARGEEISRLVIAAINIKMGDVPHSEIYR